MDVASASAVVVALVVAPNTGIKVEVDVSEVVCTVVEPDDWESATAVKDIHTIGQYPVGNKK